MAPGCAIMKFPQGILEIVMRIATAIIVLLAFLTAASAIGITNNDEEDIFETAERFRSESDRLQELVDLRDNTFGSAGYVLAISVLALVTQTVMIVLRFLNVDSISKIFTIANVIVSIFFGVALLAGGISTAVFAADYADFIDDSSGAGDAQDQLEMIRNALAACSAFCLLGMIGFAFLGVWMVLFLIRGWNDKLQETS